MSSEPPPRRRTLLRWIIAVVVMSLLLWMLWPRNPYSDAISITEKLQTKDNLSEEELLTLETKLGRAIDQLTPAQRAEVNAYRDRLHQSRQIDKLKRFFSSTPAEQKLALDAELQRRNQNNAAQRQEQQAVANLPPTPTFPATLNGDGNDLDQASRQVLDESTATDRALQAEFERSVAEHQKSHR